jgi:hypothetical protein
VEKTGAYERKGQQDAGVAFELHWTEQNIHTVGVVMSIKS